MNLKTLCLMQKHREIEEGSFHDKRISEFFFIKQPIQRMKLVYPTFAVCLSILLNTAHINAQPDSSPYFALLPFIAFAPYMSVLASYPRYPNWLVYILSTFMFSAIGLSIASHFSLGRVYGLSIGLLQGFIIPLLLFVPYRGDRGIVWVITVVATWTAIEYLVAQTYGIAVTLPIQLYRMPLLLQPISVVGAPALDGLLMASNALLGLLLSEKRCSTLTSRKSRLIVLWTSMVSVWVFWSVYLWEELQSSEASYAKVSTISPGRRFNGDPSDLLNMTQNSVNAGAQFVVWPEVYIQPDAVGMSCIDYVERSISPHLSSIDAYVVVGCEEVLQGDCESGNIAVTLGPGGKVIGSYGKQHPVFMIGERSCARNGYPNYPIQISGPTKNAFAGMSFSTLICYDMDFEDSSSIVADMGASLILNPSEDWSAARGHFAASVFRAVENRVAVAKADWGWDSAIIQPNGVISAMYDSKTIHRETLFAQVPIYPQKSTFNRLRNNAFAWTCGSFGLIMLLINFRRAWNAPALSQSDVEAPLL